VDQTRKGNKTVPTVMLHIMYTGTSVINMLVCQVLMYKCR